MKWQIVLAMVVVAVLVLLLSICALQTEELKYEMKNKGAWSCVVFYDSKGVKTAKVCMRNRGYSNNIAFFEFYLWHRVSSKVESLKITISPNVSADIYLKTPDGYPWNPIKLQRSKDDPASVTLEVPDMGFQGEGTVTLDFIVVPHKKSDALLITVETEFELSEGLKRYTGRSVLLLQSYSEVVGDV